MPKPMMPMTTSDMPLEMPMMPFGKPPMAKKRAPRPINSDGTIDRPPRKKKTVAKKKAVVKGKPKAKVTPKKKPVKKPVAKGTLPPWLGK